MAGSLTNEPLCEVAFRDWSAASPSGAGDQAFEDLYGRVFPETTQLVTTLLSQHSLPTSESEFIANGVMAKLFRAIRNGQFDTTRPFKPWLNKITRNTLTDWLRRNKYNSNLDEGGESSISEDHDPLRSLIQSEDAAVVREMLQALPDDERAVMELHYLEELSVPQIEVRLNKTKGAVRGLLHRAKVRLRESLDPDLDTIHSQ